jgi:hypothetical protein
LERPIFVRERSDGLYRVVTYLIFKLTEELILGGLVAIVFALLVWLAFAGAWLALDASQSAMPWTSPCVLAACTVL